MPGKTLVPLLVLALASTVATSAQAADSWKIKRQVWSDISVTDSYVYNGVFKRSIDFVGGRVPTNYGTFLAPICRTSDGRIGGATPYKSGTRWRMKCLGETYTQGARALKFKSRYTSEADTFTRARGRLPHETVMVQVDGARKALCLAKIGGQNIPGVMDIPSVDSDAALPPCKVWLMGQLTPISKWSIVKHTVSIPKTANVWWSPGNGTSLPQLPPYITGTRTAPLCRSHEVFGAKWPGAMRKSNGPNGRTVYCDFTYLDRSGNVKAGKSPFFEIYLAADPTKPTFPKWGAARSSANADYSKGLQISKHNGEWIYFCSQTYGKRGLSMPSNKKCRAANGSAAREGNFKLLERK